MEEEIGGQTTYIITHEWTFFLPLFPSLRFLNNQRVAYCTVCTELGGGQSEQKDDPVQMYRMTCSERPLLNVGGHEINKKFRSISMGIPFAQKTIFPFQIPEYYYCFVSGTDNRNILRYSNLII